MLCLAQLLCFSAAASADPQFSTLRPGPEPAVTDNGTWKTEYSDSRVRIESSLITFDNSKEGIKHERIVFRYTNLSTQNLTVSFDRTLYYNGVCYGCEHPDKRFSVTLAPGETKAYSDVNRDKTYFIFSRDLNQTITKTLDRFQLLNIETQVK